MIQVIENFITPQEETQLLSHLKPSRVVTGFSRNRVYRYGSSLPYKGKTELIPIWLSDLCIRVSDQWRSMGFGYVDHVTINEYHRDQSIDWHIDSKESGPVITVLSLESEALMGLKDKDGTVKVPLPVRSLLHLTDSDRWEREHCIYPVTSHRWSLVFRKGTK